MEKSKSNAKPTPPKSKFFTNISIKKSTSSITSASPVISTLPTTPKHFTRITLNCLVYHNPLNCYFQITAKNEIDTELNELIKKYNKPDFNIIVIKKLLLWIVDVSLNITQTFSMTLM
jgi:hypothetical protein